ncbi:MAG: lytic transglycosylase domain-containing protein [Comamonadaceae bacterium]|nr:MAG: lytic transglycosylase domain-containing protein [Comamonadaceae bacterium]
MKQARQLLASVFLALGLLCLPHAALADVWGYVDAKGIAHFANERIDERYELFFRGGETFDTRDGVRPDARADYPRPVAVPGSQAKLLTYFDLSPSFKAVRHHIREASYVNQIDFELIQALIATESGFDVDAVSPKGAVGLMQLIPATAQRYGVNGDKKTPIEKKLTDPRINIRAGSRYLGDLIKMFPGKLELALAAYNAGEGAVQRAGNRIPNYKETQNYVKTVMALYTMLKPVSVADPRRAPSRVQMELKGATAAAPAMSPGGFPQNAPVGGAVGRGNMISPMLRGTPVAAAPVPPGLKVEQD